MPVQWVHVGGDVLFASDRSAWIQRAEFVPAVFLAPMSGSAPTSVASTRNLLDGAIAAAERTAAVGSPPSMTALRWAWQLLSQWHSAHRSLALLKAAIERFSEMGRRDLAGFAREKLSEEEGHDAYPLADLEALGYDAGALVRGLAPDDAIIAGLDYARAALTGERPAQFLGYVYAIERRVIRISADWFAALDRVLPPGVDGASGLRAHATDLDHAHVEEAVAFFTSLSADDRAAVATGCHRITQIRCAGYAEAQPTEAQLEAWLEPFAAGALVSGA